MDETLTPVDDGQVSDEGSQTPEIDPAPQTEEPEQTVNAESVEVTPDKPVQTKEDNAQFAKVRREAEARAKAEFEAKEAAKNAEFTRLAAEQGWTDSQGNPITTEDAYWREVKLQAQMKKLIDGGADPDKAALQIELERLKGEQKAAQETRAEQERKSAEYKAFFDYYAEVHGRAFTLTDTIPDEVTQIAAERKVPLDFAYAMYRERQERAEKKNLALGKQTAEANAKNAQTSTGSVTGNGQADNGVLSEELISAMSPKEMERRWPEIKKFYKMK